MDKLEEVLDGVVTEEEVAGIRYASLPSGGRIFGVDGKDLFLKTPMVLIKDSNSVFRLINLIYPKGYGRHRYDADLLEQNILSPLAAKMYGISEKRVIAYSYKGCRFSYVKDDDKYYMLMGMKRIFAYTVKAVEENKMVEDMEVLYRDHSFVIEMVVPQLKGDASAHALAVGIIPRLSYLIYRSR